MQTALTKLHQNVFHDYLVLITEIVHKISNGKGHFLPLNLSIKNFLPDSLFLLYLLPHVLIITHELKIALILPPRRCSQG